MPPSEVWTFGYGGRSLNRFAVVVRERDALVLDIRIMPWSQKYPQWTWRNLGQTLGWHFHPREPGRYIDFRSWGNRNRVCGGPMEIANWDFGLKRFEALPEQPVILLCCCRSQVTCHRGYIALRLREIGYSVRELPWGRQAAAEPPRDPNELVLTP